jgi:hypothetical protein
MSVSVGVTVPVMMTVIVILTVITSAVVRLMMGLIHQGNIMRGSLLRYHTNFPMCAKVLTVARRASTTHRYSCVNTQSTSIGAVVLASAERRLRLAVWR